MTNRYSRLNLLELFENTARLLRVPRHGQTLVAGTSEVSDSLRRNVLRHLNHLVVRIWGGTADATDFRRLRAKLATLALTTTEFASVIARLDNARTYLMNDEPGAATYELRLLGRSLTLRGEYNDATLKS